jgi:hypothetical protein
MSVEPVRVDIRESDEGHWVEWTASGEKHALGPYHNRAVAENVRDAKQQEFAQNTRHIDEV